MNTYLRKITITLVTFWTLFTINLLHADDIESLQGDNNGTSNILFIMDLSGSMGIRMNNTTRLKVMQESLAAIIEQAKPNMRIGLMTFGPGEDNYVQGVQFPVSDITTIASELLGDTVKTDNIAISPKKNETTQQFLARMTTQWKAGGGTPIVDALYEAALYFRGEKMYWGNSRAKPKRAAHPLTFNARNKKYISPITNQCQANYAVLLSDGSPTYNLIANSPLAQSIKASGCRSTTISNGQCAAEITQLMANSDNNSSIPGDQKVETFTIGLGDMNSKLQDYMRSLVTSEDDPSTSEREGYFVAKNKDQLVEAFNSIFEDINKKTPTFSSPSYSLSTDNNGMSHDGNAYVPLVVTSSTAAWFGNLKKFKVKQVGNNIRTFVGKNNQPAFSEAGEIKEDAFDYWSASNAPDGSDNLKGGVASVLSQINPNKRALYTNIKPGDLSQSANHISTNNQQLSSQLLNASNSERTALLKYIRGLKASKSAYGGWVDNDKGIGDILHFKPISLTYGDNKKYIIVGTNEGFLHVFDENTGKEVFAFMPKALLPNIKKRYENKPLSEDNPNIYGVDGEATLWHNDLNKNSKVDKDLNEKAYLYFGLRRGGTGYYALDITDINSPSLLWSYNSDGSNKTLGQSWSKPYLARVFDKDDTLKTVIVITGGYDPAHDDPNTITKPLSQSAGNNIVMLDAKTGSVLWTLKTDLKEGADQLKHSIPGGARLIDMNRNGAIDRLYFGDTGGNLWRLDINESLGKSKSFTAPTQLTQLASLSGNSSNSRQFYNEPELSILKHKTTTSLALAIGSGLRPHPKNEEIDDHLFVLLDRNVYNLPEKTSTSTPTIADISSNTLINRGDDDDDKNDDEDSDNNCIIYSQDKKSAAIYNFYKGKVDAVTQVVDTLICEQYDDPSLNPENALKSNSSKLNLNKYIKECEKSTDLSCSESMPYNKAVSLLREKATANLVTTPINENTTVLNTNNSTTVAIQHQEQNTQNIVTMSQLATITSTDEQGDLVMNYGKLTDTNLIDSNIAGWHFELPVSGEKSLSSAMTNEGTIFFTSYLPKVASVVDSKTGCMGSSSSGRLYAFDVLTAKPSIDLNQDKLIDEKDTYLTIASQAIPETPQRYYNELNCSSETCNHIIDIRVNTMSEQATSYDQTELQSIYWIAP